MLAGCEKNRRIVLFGAGEYGKKAIQMLGAENIEYILDNDRKKWGKTIGNVTIYGIEEKLGSLKGYQVAVTVSPAYQAEVTSQLSRLGVKELVSYEEIQEKYIRQKIERRLDYIRIYQKTIRWIQENTVDGHCVICHTDKRCGYPEVTGYYIPTLLRWGYRELALSYAKWLCEIQKPDGSWYDADGTAPYVFDTAQIIKGLLAIRELYPAADPCIIKGCDWVISNMEETGRLRTPVMDAWGDSRTCSELIHLYALSPLVHAAEVFHMPKYQEAACRILGYYKENCIEEIMQLGLLSHFYAYVMEGLLDLGEEALVRKAMEKVAGVQKESGAVPAYHDVDWVCSTGLFQLALVWFRLGEGERGRRAFTYACKLQNDSGGWYGSYLSEENRKEVNTYFPSSEISWAAKYFLDALYWKNKLEFEEQAPQFKNTLKVTDGRYMLIEEAVREICEGAAGTCPKIADIGCGKGAYLKNLLEREPRAAYVGVDLSETVMGYIGLEEIESKQGSLTNIPYADNSFDLTYTCEALEHAIDIERAIVELARVTKPGGIVIVIDKNKDALGRMEIGEWEQWFDETELRDLMLRCCSEVQIAKEVGYEAPADGLFYAWTGRVK